MANRLTDRLASELNKRQENDSLRTLSSQRNLVDFCSNDYLGLSRSRELRQLVDEASAELRMNMGSTGSRLISGNSALFEEVESYLANLFKGERSLLFNSGYNANVGLLSCVPGRHSVILYDELVHASIKEGMRLSHGQKVMFKHNDMDDLANKLRSKHEVEKYIVVESIYSMDGDRCPLEEIVCLAEEQDAYIILDEAHSTGVIGENGAGISVNAQLHDRIFARIYTFGKAMGVHGACVVGDNVLIDYLINFSRSFIYTTALSPHAILAIKSSFMLLAEHPEWQEELNEVIAYFKSSAKEKLTEHHFIIESDSAIQGVIIPGNEVVRKVAINLQNKGFDVRPILSPTVPEGSERLRICLHRYNTRKEIDEMIEVLTSLKA